MSVLSVLAALPALPPGTEPALRESWGFFVHLAVVLVPLFLVGSLFVGLTKEYLPPEAVERRLRGHDEGAGNVVAAGFGAVTPFCSCSTVPVLAGLLQAGAPMGLAFSFLLASPLVNELAVLLLFGAFGLEVTLLYVVTTFTAAVVGGFVVGRLGLEDHLKDVELLARNRPVATDGGAAANGSTRGCGDDCASEALAPSTRSHRQRIGDAARNAWSFFVDTLPYLLVGMTVGALIHGAVPVSMVRAVLGTGNPVAVPLAALAGAPVYVSMSGMLPIAESLASHGVPIGTVVAFVVGGAGVSIPNLVLLNKLFDRRLLAVYAGTVVVIGTAVGLLFNLVV